MKLYKDFQPTSFDCRGLGLENRQNWFVLGVSRTRDSELLEECNFDCALEMLGGESKSVEVHRFNHWGPGWFEIILISPRARKKIAIGEDIESSLENYPVLNDDKFSALEHEAQMEHLEESKLTLTEELEERLGISDLTLPDTFWQYALDHEMLHFNEDHYPQWAAASKLPLTVLVEQKAEFYFPTEEDGSFDFYSDIHPDCLSAPLMRALAAAEVQGRPYTYTNGLPLVLPLWAYPNPNQTTLNLET